MTIRPTPFGRWGAPAVLAAASGLFLWNGVLNLGGGIAQAWLFFAIGLGAVAVAALATTLYISADDSSVVYGTILTRRRFQRRDLAGIRASHSPATRLTFFVRRDGSEVLLTSGYLWGQERLSGLAAYLGVPLDW
jgi:hypothetical protein